MNEDAQSAERRAGRAGAGRGTTDLLVRADVAGDKLDADRVLHCQAMALALDSRLVDDDPPVGVEAWTDAQHQRGPFSRSDAARGELTSERETDVIVEHRNLSDRARILQLKRRLLLDAEDDARVGLDADLSTRRLLRDERRLQMNDRLARTYGCGPSVDRLLRIVDLEQLRVRGGHRGRELVSAAARSVETVESSRTYASIWTEDGQGWAGDERGETRARDEGWTWRRRWGRRQTRGRRAGQGQSCLALRGARSGAITSVVGGHGVEARSEAVDGVGGSRALDEARSSWWTRDASRLERGRAGFPTRLTSRVREREGWKCSG